MPTRRRSSARAWLVRGLFLSMLVVLGAASAVGWSWFDAHAAVPLPIGGAMVFIPSGTSFRSAADKLMAAGVIRHAWNFQLWGRLTGADRQVQSGDYAFHDALSPLDVLERLRSGENALHTVTVPEGSTVQEIVKAFEAGGFGGADQFLCLERKPGFLLGLDLPPTGMEGYLYPDTYRMTWNQTPEQILQMMVKRYRDEAQRLDAKRRAADLTEHEMVTLASIIEKETGIANERPLVSAVFRNRLRLGMKLQADPTTVYGRERNAVPTAADLELDTPYNTYTRAGLPPGPICSPGRAALEAAVEPAKVDYLFFVARGDGSHVFSRTLEQHQAHVSELRRRQATNP